MSSYLTFYIVPKEENSKPLSLISYSRSSEIYQYFNDTLNVAYIGIEGETQYTEITIDKINKVISELNRDIGKAQRRVSEYEKHASGNSELIEEILSQKEWIEELQNTLNKVEFIRDLVIEASYSCTSYSKILCNID